MVALLVFFGSGRGEGWGSCTRPPTTSLLQPRGIKFCFHSPVGGCSFVGVGGPVKANLTGVPMSISKRGPTTGHLPPGLLLHPTLTPEGSIYTCFLCLPEFEPMQGEGHVATQNGAQAARRQRAGEESPLLGRVMSGRLPGGGGQIVKGPLSSPQNHSRPWPSAR